jgi:hypothetical protein
MYKSKIHAYTDACTKSKFCNFIINFLQNLTSQITVPYILNYRKYSNKDTII